MSVFECNVHYVLYMGALFCSHIYSILVCILWKGQVIFILILRVHKKTQMSENKKYFLHADVGSTCNLKSDRVFTSPPESTLANPSSPHSKSHERKKSKAVPRDYLLTFSLALELSSV